VAEYRDRAARAEAELKNFRTRVERDRAANREVVIAEVLRQPAPGDRRPRARGGARGPGRPGSPLTLVAQKLRAGFERYGLVKIGEKGEPFDPKIHEAIMQIHDAEATSATIADVIESGYAIGERCCARPRSPSAFPSRRAGREATWRVRTGSTRTSTPCWA
jgi:molecular chaperone GrpE